MLKAIDGLAADRKLLQIARDVYGADRVAEQGLDSDSDLRARARRLVKKARYMMKDGYLDLAAGRRPRI